MTIVAYTYRADTYCPACIYDIAMNAAPDLHVGGEDALDHWAQRLGITDRTDERRYDSGDFPKVVLSDQLNDCGWEHCPDCDDHLGHDETDCRPTAPIEPNL